MREGLRRVGERVRRLIVIGVCLVLLQGCTEAIRKRSDIYPIRKVTVTTVAGRNVSCEDAGRLYVKTNEYLEPQVGIVLYQEVCADTDVKMPSDFMDAMNRLYQEYPEPGTDMVIWLDRDTGELIKRGLLKLLMIPQPQAAIDDVYRRYVVMRGLDPIVLLHEIGHAFIFSHTHSEKGVMKGVGIQLFPGTPVISSGKFCEEDRDEIIRNKFRDFSKKVKLEK